MANKRFSGGVLFAIILEACPIADNRKNFMNGGTATFKSSEILQELAQLSGLKRNTPSSQDASEYKKCKAQGAMYLQTKKFIQDFEHNIEVKYDELHKRATLFVETYLFDSRKEHEAVAERIYLALDLSRNIPDEASFYYLDKKITKTELLKLTEVDLPALILAVWFYCIKNIQNNRKGEDLFNYLFENADKGNIYHFNKTIENRFQNVLEVNSGDPNVREEYELPPLDEVDEMQPEPEADDSVDQSFVPEAKNVTKIETPSASTQTINFNFTVNGDNANVRNIVNNGTYIEGGDDDGK
jgi:hypothetical protein